MIDKYKIGTDADIHPAPVIFIASREDLWHLVSELRRDDREHPIIVLVLGERAEDWPPPDAISKLDPAIPIYLIRQLRLSRQLADVLGHEFAVGSGDARIFWTGLGQEGDAADHLLVPAYNTNDSRGFTERLASAVEYR